MRRSTTALPDAHCVMHTHTTAGVAVACTQGGLAQNNFYSAQLHDLVAYHDFEGITIHADEAPRLLKSIGDKPAVILRNHGLLAWGQTLPLTFVRSCGRCSAPARSRWRRRRWARPSRCRKRWRSRLHADSFQFDQRFGAGQDVFDALVRQVDRIDASYKN